MSNTTKLQPPVSNPNNVEAKKFYIFNETGNIMISSTAEPGTPISDEVQKVFSEVSVFFAGMSRSISTTTNPDTGNPFSLYNYNALESIISGSGLFVHVTEEDIEYTTSTVGVDFSKELLEGLLGLATGAGEMAFAQAMIASIGQEGLKINSSSTRSDSKVCNIVFVCEYLLGMPVISAIVVYADATMHEQQINFGPCFSETSKSLTWTMHKDTYMFVTPTFIRKYAGDLDSINTDPQYLEMISWFSGLLLQTPEIMSIADASDASVNLPSETALAVGSTYEILGQFLGTSGTLQFAGTPAGTTVTAGTPWGPDKITFTVTGTLATAAAIEILDDDGNKIASTPQTFTIA